MFLFNIKKLIIQFVLRVQALRSSQKALILCIGLAIVGLAVPQAWSLNKSAEALGADDEILDQVPSQSKLDSVLNQGLRPIPANRLDQAKRSTDGKRNPFVAISSQGTDGNSQFNGQNFSPGLSSVRLTGIVQEGSSLKALVEDGSRYDTLSLGDHLDFGTLDGSGLRVVAISFDQGSISISNGRSEYQLYVSQ